MNNVMSLKDIKEENSSAFLQASVGGLDEGGAGGGGGDGSHNPIDGDSTTPDNGSSRYLGASATSGAGSGSSKKETFVQKETRYVLLLRILVVSILVCTAIAISVVLYQITNDGESENFESQYQAVASKMMGTFPDVLYCRRAVTSRSVRLHICHICTVWIKLTRVSLLYLPQTDTFLEIAKSKMGAAASLAVAEIAYGQDTAKTWPFVTMSSFQQRAKSIKDLSGVLYIGMNPMVESALRQKWQFYTNTDLDKQWYQDGLEYQRDRDLDYLDTRPQVETEDSSLEVSDGIASQIFTFEEEEEDDSNNEAIKAPWTQPIYLPVWQTSPVTSRTIVNQDMMNVRGAKKAIEYQSVVFERMQFAAPGYANSTESRKTSEFGFLLSMANENETMYEGDIFSSVYFPLYNNFDADREVVGIMRTVIQWGRYFSNVLPESDVGIVLVLENNGCDEPYSYTIQGTEVFPLGHGDLHDPQFDAYEMTASMEDITQLNDGTKYGMDISHDDCPYSIRVYPSQDFYNAYNTKTPLVVTISVAVVFAFCILMFFFYDRLVEWRQALIVAKAAQTHKIVASLFPKNVRERMLEEKSTTDNNKKKNRGGAASSQVKDFLDTHEDGAGGGEDPMGSPPIADLFPNTTGRIRGFDVLLSASGGVFCISKLYSLPHFSIQLLIFSPVFFADISGFTSWSSSREPVQVFLLLESLYKAYDDVASRRRYDSNGPISFALLEFLSRASISITE